MNSEEVASASFWGMGYGTSSRSRLDFRYQKGIIQISWRINLNKNFSVGN